MLEELSPHVHVLLYFHFVTQVRVNEHLVLTALHTLFVREHNRLCRHFAAHNPELNDEELYNLAR